MQQTRDDGSARDGTDDAMREAKMWYDWDTSDDKCTLDNLESWNNVESWDDLDAWEEKKLWEDW